MTKKTKNSGYSAQKAKKITGASQRQLDYWDEIGLIQPSQQQASGKGSKREYSYTDLVRLRTVVSMRQVGISLQKVRRALEIIKSWNRGSKSWAKRKLISDGNDIFITTSDRRVLKSVLKNGQLAFSVIMLGEIVEEAHKRISVYKKQKATG